MNQKSDLKVKFNLNGGMLLQLQKRFAEDLEWLHAPLSKKEEVATLVLDNNLTDI